jgi:endonuclease/exonuclease/phosphatase family metal-dependent hydrolase
MVHLARLLSSTKSQVCFISKTRNSSITRASLINRFNAYNAFVVPALGQSGGLWLIWNDQVNVNIVDHSHHYIFVLCDSKLTSKQFALVCIYGDPHHRVTNAIWDKVLHFVVDNSTLPTICMGDMNEIMHPREKSGPGTPDMHCINVFCDHVKQCGLIDLGYSGLAYTWCNKRFTSTPTFQRLDRALANADWCIEFPATTVYHLPMLRSDHAPILTMLHSNRARTNKPFCFENWWLMEQDFQEVAKQSWQRSAR